LEFDDLEESDGSELATIVIFSKRYRDESSKSGFDITFHSDGYIIFRRSLVRSIWPRSLGNPFPTRKPAGRGRTLSITTKDWLCQLCREIESAPAIPASLIQMMNSLPFLVVAELV
jgi:hypothetical protein